MNRRISHDILKPIKLKSTATIMAKVLLGSNGLAQIDFEIRVGDDLFAIAESRLARVDTSDMAF